MIDVKLMRDLTCILHGKTVAQAEQARLEEAEAVRSAVTHKTTIPEHFWQKRFKLERKAEALDKLYDVLNEIDKEESK